MSLLSNFSNLCGNLRSFSHYQRTLSCGQRCFSSHAVHDNSRFRHKVKKPRRAVMYVPGHDEKKLKKIPSLRADCILLDCEDGVGYDKKEDARNTITNMHNEIAANYSREIGVRINSSSSGMASDDLEALFSMEHLPSCIAVPKIDTYQEMQWVCNQMNQTFRKQNRRRLKERINIIFMCESGQSLMNLKEIIEAGICASAVKNHHACLQISGVIFGSDDFCADLEITRSQDAAELMYVRQKLVATAKSFGLQVIDMVYIDYKDPDGLREQSLQGAKLGFTGKQVIHPNQVDIVQQCFSPSKEKLEWAKQLLEAFQVSENKGVFTFRGQMIDMPTILQAQNIVRISENLTTE